LPVAEHVVRWSMTATHAEILRTLPPELASAGAREGRLAGEQGNGRWELELVPAAPLCVGGLELEVTELVIRLRGFSEAEHRAFISRLEQYTRRGGG
jgi:hypothetical protein